MSVADIKFIENCKDILENGFSDVCYDVRPTWADTGEKAHTIKKFCIVNRYDLTKEFPIITLRKTFFNKLFQTGPDFDLKNCGFGRKNPTM